MCPTANRRPTTALHRFKSYIFRQRKSFILSEFVGTEFGLWLHRDNDCGIPFETPDELREAYFRDTGIVVPEDWLKEYAWFARSLALKLREE